MKLASIEVIRELRPHPNADRLELAVVEGWQSVVKKGEFQVGDKVVFIVIDTILPLARWSEFLSNKDNPSKEIRLKTARLRGEYSQGLALPLDTLHEHDSSLNLEELLEGAEVSEIIGVKKYEKEMPAGLTGVALGPFPSHLCARTDEENGLGDVELANKILQEKITVTLKLDGSSCTIVVENGEIVHVCSRRLRLQENEDNGFWKVGRKLELGGIGSGRLILQGELMGPKIQGNQLLLKEPELYVFQILRDGNFLNYNEMEEVCQKILRCRVVHLVGNFEGGMTLAELQDLADQQSLFTGKPAEGLVVRPQTYRKGGEGRPEGFKLINRNYGE